MQGYILTADFEDRGNQHLLKYGCIGPQGPFEIIITNSKPLFFVQRRSEIKNLGVKFERKNVALQNFVKDDVDALYFNTQKDLYEAKDKLENLGVRTFEADVRPTERFLMERFVNASIQVDGQSDFKDGQMSFVNPKISKSDYRPNFNIMSLDIETSMGNDLYSIGIHQRGPSGEFTQVYMVGNENRQVSDTLHLYSSEKELITEFMKQFHEMDPDIIVGWHIIGFDFKFLERKFVQYGIPFNWGRGNSKLFLKERKGMGWFANMRGRVIIDGPPALRAAFYSFENFKLDTVAKEVLDHGKDIQSGGSDKVEEIERRFHEDKEGLAKYNLLDCTLVLDIYKKLGLVDLMVTRSMLSGMLLDRLGSSTGAFDHFMLPKIHRKGVVAGNTVDISREGQSTGGYVLEPKEGLHDHCIVLDFKSLYPSIIKTFKIDPLSRLKADVNTLNTPEGYRFSRSEHVLPAFIETLFERRSQAKMMGDEYLSQAIKILMNSFYGVMGSGGSRFYHAELPTAITTTGHWILKQTIARLESRDYEVVYGDTDSVFVKLKFTDIGNIKRVADKLVNDLNTYLTEKIEKEFGLKSHLVLEFEKYFRKLYLPPSRSGEGGAKKRYVGLQVHDNHDEVKFSGMEFVRSDWTKLAKNFQYELYRRLFAEEDIKDFIKSYVDRLKEGEFDDLLIYKKRLTKDASEYIKTIPPHVKAAKLLLEKDPDRRIRSIEYKLTRRGPMPIELDCNDVDYQHYIDKQLRPLADDVLWLMESSFEDLITGDQLSLF